MDKLIASKCWCEIFVMILIYLSPVLMEGGGFGLTNEWSDLREDDSSNFSIALI